MKIAIAALVLAASAAAAPAAAASSSNSGFTIISARSASPIHLQPVNAAGRFFWIGKPTATYCPLAAPGCAPYTNDTTALVCGNQAGQPTGCSMDVVVPGGQQVYVDPATGALGYTQAHSASMPADALTSGFTYKAAKTQSDLGSFDFEYKGHTGLVACPQGSTCNLQTGKGCGPWKVYAALPGFNFNKCLGFGALTKSTTGAAWQYT